MTYNEVRDMIARGWEYNFEYKDKFYWISQNKEGIYLTEYEPDDEKDGITQPFKNSEELLEKGRIKGKTILMIWDEIGDQF